MSVLERVTEELRKYEHPFFEFSARDTRITRMGAQTSS